MVSPAGIIRVLYTFNPPKKLSTSFVILFVLIQLLFGMNYGFFATIRSKHLKALANVVSFLSFLFATFAMLWKIHEANIVLYLFQISNMAYFLISFILLRFSKYTLYQFLTELVDVDEKWCLVVKDSYVGLKALLYNAICFFISSCLYIHLCVTVFKVAHWSVAVHLFSQHMICTVIHSFTVVNMIVFYQIYLRMQVLKSAFDGNFVRIKDLMIIFKSLADILVKIRATQDSMIVLGFVADLIRWVVTIWFQLFAMQDSVTFFVHIISNMVLSILNITLPALFAEMIAAKRDEIKLAIHERLVIETDATVIQDLTRLLRYVEARPLLRKAWRLVPVDLRLPTTLLSMSATYLIVIIQFTHLYD